MRLGTKVFVDYGTYRGATGELVRINDFVPPLYIIRVPNKDFPSQTVEIALRRAEFHAGLVCPVCHRVIVGRAYAEGKLSLCAECFYQPLRQSPVEGIGVDVGPRVAHDDSGFTNAVKCIEDNNV